MSRIMQGLKALKDSNRQTKYFIFMVLIYLIAIVWTTVQSYARLEYSRSNEKTLITNPNKS